MAAPQKWGILVEISIRFLTLSQAMLQTCESHQCSHSLLTACRDAFLTNALRGFPGTPVLQHGHTAELCCPPVSAHPAPSRRNAATSLAHPDPTAFFMCPTQSRNMDFKRKLSILGKCILLLFCCSLVYDVKVEVSKSCTSDTNR